MKALEMAWETRNNSGGVMFHSDSNNAGIKFIILCCCSTAIGVITDAVKTFPHPDSHSNEALCCSWTCRLPEAPSCEASPHRCA